jgi:Immunity protein 17
MPLAIIILIALGFFAGLLFLAAAYFDWDWWFRNWGKDVALLGRDGARVFCTVAGVVLMSLSIWLAASFIRNKASRAAQDAEIQRQIDFALDHTPAGTSQDK